MAARNAPALPLLGGQSAVAFLARYWQRKALLVRGAVPGFGTLFSRPQLQALAGRDEVESRVVLRSGRTWRLEHGPFRPAFFRQLPPHDWTLMVQGVNLHDERADALLRSFPFLPYARLDDLMITYAAPGGGVGPHFDSYDVFLLQGFGHRRWRYGQQDDLAIRPGLPVRILQRFEPAHDAVLAPGDMLYLPPGYAHDGVAVDACTTYSIGFRAPSHTELAQAFLDHLRDAIDLPGRYEDPDLRPTTHPARVSATMQQRMAGTLRRIRWSRQDVDRFVGMLLSEPKADVVFDPPAARSPRGAFASMLKRRGAQLDRRTRWLYDDDFVYVNGEAHAWPAGARAPLARLADTRGLSANHVSGLSAAAVTFLHRAYCHGFLHLA